MKKIISLLCVIALLLGVALSTTSCLSLSAIIDVLSSEEEPGEQTPPQDEGGNDEQNPPAGDENQGGNAAEGGEGGPDFLPDRDGAQESAEALTGPKRALLSTVSIVAKFTTRDELGYISDSAMAGAGVVYKLDKESGDAYIITNFHVVYNFKSVNPNGISNDISVYLYGQKYDDYKIPASYVGGSLNYDIAVLKVEDSEVIKNSPVLTAELGDSEAVRVFDKVFVIGNPEASGISVTEGIVSVESEDLPMMGADGKTEVKFRVMRVSAAVNSGNSGGGLYDENGNLIGIINAKRQGADIDNIGYAIPVNLAVALAENIIYNCDGNLKTSLYKCMLGVTVSIKATGLEINPDTEDVKITEEVYVKEISDSSIVKGKVLVGDVITSITVDGVRNEVTRLHHVTDNMLYARPGSTVTLEITRGSSNISVNIEMTESSVSIVL